jgi:hypothetical protein
MCIVYLAYFTGIIKEKSMSVSGTDEGNALHPQKILERLKGIRRVPPSGMQRRKIR